MNKKYINDFIHFLKINGLIKKYIYYLKYSNINEYNTNYLNYTTNSLINWLNINSKETLKDYLISGYIIWDSIIKKEDINYVHWDSYNTKYINYLNKIYK